MKTACSLIACMILLGGATVNADSSILERSNLKNIYIIQLSHLDIGFTGTQAEVAKISAETIDRAIELCAENPDYKWTIESIWQLEQWMAGKSPERIKELMNLVKAGRIGLAACYAGMVGATMGSEEFCRSLYFAERLRRKYGVSIETAIQNDIPGYSWAYPQVLAKSGVKYFATGVNNFIGAGAEIPRKDRPFYWEGPDGSRVLTFICSDPGIKESGYLHGLWEYKWGPGGEAERTVPELLERLEQEGYPYDSILVMAGTGDNGGTNLAMVEGAREWNSKHDSPKMIIANPDEFFHHMESKYAGRFPVYRGDWSGLWDQNAQGVPYGVALSRQVHDELPQAEALSSLADILGLRAYPKTDIDSAWENVITFDEHSGGGGWPGTLTAEQTREGNITAIGYAQTASKRTSAVLRDSMTALSSQVRSQEDSIFVWNPTAHTRTGIIRIGETIFQAENVPGLGYKSYVSHTSHGPSPAVTAGSDYLENEHLRLEVGENGLVTSLKDKHTGRELVDRKSKYGFGQLVQASKEHNGPVAFEKPSIQIGQSGSLMASLIITDQKSPLSRTEITLCAGEPVVRFKHSFDMRRTPHMAYDDGSMTYDIAYPLDIPEGKLAFDTPAGMLDPDADYMPKANRIVNVHHGGGITGSEVGVSFASRQAFMWEFGGINWLWGTPIPPQSTELMVRLLSKHDEAKYKERVGEVITEPGAPHVRIYETAFYIHKPGDVDVNHFLSSEANPLIAVAMGANPKGSLPGSAQLIRLEGAEFDLLAFKKAETGDGYILRLMETAGRLSEVSISSGLLSMRSAELLDNVEKPVKNLKVRDGALTVEMRPREIITIRLQLSEVGK